MTIGSKIITDLNDWQVSVYFALWHVKVENTKRGFWTHDVKICEKNGQTYEKTGLSL